MKRYDIINRFIEERGYKSYLEIGVQNGLNFSKIACENKVGVDPDENSPATYHMTSDEYFDTYKNKFDVIFIDGLHEHTQVIRDIINSFDVLNEGGVIICHDMNPTSEDMQKVPRIQKEWTGDCWRAWMYFRICDAFLEMYVIDTDYGVGVIEEGEQETVKTHKIINYGMLDSNRKEWLNLISVEEFKKCQL